MPEPVIIVTGANGQLGNEIRDLEKQYPLFRFIFLSKEDLPIQAVEKVQQYFEKVKPQYCINCAAYTAVDKAETEREMAMQVNAAAAGVLAAVCKSLTTRFIHISTDYVFDGTASIPYKEDHSTSPVNYYGSTKRAGEELCIKNNAESIIIRTSWVYSAYGNNFVKTMLRLMKEKASLNVVNDQLGSPTYAADLAKAIMMMIEKNESGPRRWVPGIYHYSNEGVISWYDFALAIKKLTGSACIIHPIPTASYPTPARRPAYSVFNTDKIQSTYNIPLTNWLESLTRVITLLIK